MKDGLENIDEIIKQAFEGFEANVDPSVWNNVQNAIGGGAGATDVTPKVDPTVVTTVATKSVITKIAVGVALVGTLGTAGYFVINSTSESKQQDEIAVVSQENNDNVDLVEKATPIEVEAPIEEKLENKETNIIIKDEVSTLEDKVEEIETITDEPSINQDNEKSGNLETQTSHIENKQNNSSPDYTKNEEATAPGKQMKTEEKKEEPKQSVESISALKEKEDKKEAEIDIIPNVITPNGDGFNDVIKITGKDLEKIELVIMDKTGKPVYRINNLEGEWNGKDQAGYDLLPGMYYMAGVVVDSEGNTKNIKQAINLIK